MFSRFIHVVEYVLYLISFYYLLTYYFMNLPYFIHSSVEEYLGFYFLVILNNAAITIHVLVFFVSLVYVHRMELLVHIVTVCFTF
jgi:hypothetical protein